MGFPITIICTLQGTSVTQGNATVFTGNKFAVQFCRQGGCFGCISNFKVQ